MIENKFADMMRNLGQDVLDQASLIYETRQNFDNQLANIKRTTSEILGQSKANSAQMKLINSEQQKIDGEMGKHINVMQALYEQATLAEQIMFLNHDMATSALQNTPILVNKSANVSTDRQPARQSAQVQLQLLKSMADSVLKCKKAVFNIGSNQATGGIPDVKRQSLDQTLRQSTDGGTSMLKDNNASVELCDNTQRSIMSNGVFDSGSN